jgi:integrase
MGKIYKRGKAYWAYWTDQYGQHRQSLKTADQQVARERLRRLELAATNPTAYSGHTLAQSIDAVFASRPTMSAATRNIYECKARNLARILGAATELASLTRDDFVAYQNQRLEEGVTMHTISKEFGVMTTAFKEAMRRGLWLGDIKGIVPVVKTGYKPRDRWLEPEEADGIVRELPTTERRIWFLVAIHTGMRASELRSFAWENIDWKRNMITVKGTKTKGSHRTIPMSAQLATWLLPLKGKGKVLAPWGNVRRDISAALARHNGIERDKGGQGARLYTKIETISPNDLRRTFCSWLVQAGVPEHVAAKLLGHSSSVMVSRVYGHLAQRNLSAAVAQLPDFCTYGVHQDRQKPALGAKPANRKRRITG